MSAQRVQPKEQPQPHKVLRYAAIALTASLWACGSSHPPDSQSASSSGTRWIDSDKLQPGAVKHDDLTPEQIERITRLQDAFREVDPTPLAEWIDDFKRDREPDGEVRIYEAMAAAYSQFCAGRNLSLDAKREVYQIVLLRSEAPDNEVLEHATLKALTPTDAREVLALYKLPPSPIRVVPTPTKP